VFQGIVRDMNDARVNVCRSAKPTRSIRLRGDCRQVMPAHCSLIYVLFVQVEWCVGGNLEAQQFRTLTHRRPICDISDPPISTEKAILHKLSAINISPSSRPTRRRRRVAADANYFVKPWMARRIED